MTFILLRKLRIIVLMNKEIVSVVNGDIVLINRNIVLIGFMGSGKTAVANYLNEHYHMGTIDTDKLIVKREGLSIQEIFSEKGEAYFRSLEGSLLEELSEMKLANTVISCGGGMVVNPENVVKMREIGVVVYLSASPGSIYQRVKDDGERPLLNDNMNVEFIGKLLSKRKEFYEKAADIRIKTDGKSVMKICQEIMRKIL